MTQTPRRLTFLLDTRNGEGEGLTAYYTRSGSPPLTTRAIPIVTLESAEGAVIDVCGESDIRLLAHALSEALVLFDKGE
jgi:hypothetical protein